MISQLTLWFRHQQRKHSEIIFSTLCLMTGPSDTAWDIGNTVARVSKVGSDFSSTFRTFHGLFCFTQERVDTEYRQVKFKFKLFKIFSVSFTVNDWTTTTATVLLHAGKNKHSKIGKYFLWVDRTSSGTTCNPRFNLTNTAANQVLLVKWLALAVNQGII